MNVKFSVIIAGEMEVPPGFSKEEAERMVTGMLTGGGSYSLSLAGAVKEFKVNTRAAADLVVPSPTNGLTLTANGR